MRREASGLELGVLLRLPLEWKLGFGLEVEREQEEHGRRVVKMDEWENGKGSVNLYDGDKENLMNVMKLWKSIKKARSAMKKGKLMTSIIYMIGVFLFKFCGKRFN